MAAEPPIPLDPYVLDVLLPDLVGHDKRPAALVLYLALWRRSSPGFGPVRLSHQALCNATGLSRSAVQDSLEWLRQRRLLQVRKATPTSVPEHTVLRPWTRRQGG
jgi:hypothetical protein